MVLGRTLLSRPSLDIYTNRGAPFPTKRSALQSVFNGKGFHGERFLRAVLIRRPPDQDSCLFRAYPLLYRCRIPLQTRALGHQQRQFWPCEGNSTRQDEIIDNYNKTLAQIGLLQAMQGPKIMALTEASMRHCSSNFRQRKQSSRLLFPASRFLVGL